ncbi:MAG: amidohydrolase family protein, partial [Candidatus Firestonebacteria bacterium]
FLLIGELCQYLQGYPAKTPLMYPIIEKSIELNIPLHFHASDPEHVKGILHYARKYKDAKIIMSHMGGMRYLNQNVPVIIKARLKNLWVDVSGGCFFRTEYFERIVKELGDDKVLFGTDLYNWNPSSFVARLKFADIPLSSKKKIASENLKKIL